MLRDGPFRTLVLLNLLVCTVFSTPWVGLPLTMAGEGLEPDAYGRVIAVNGVVIVVFQLLVNKLTERRSQVTLLVVSSLLFAVGTGATALAGTPLLFAATVVVWTVGEMVYVPVTAAATAHLAPVHARGRYQGLMGMSWSVGGFVAPIAAGWIVGGPGPEVLWASCAVIGVAARPVRAAAAPRPVEEAPKDAGAPSRDPRRTRRSPRAHRGRRTSRERRTHQERRAHREGTGRVGGAVGTGRRGVAGAPVATVAGGPVATVAGGRVAPVAADIVGCLGGVGRRGGAVAGVAAVGSGRGGALADRGGEPGSAG